MENKFLKIDDKTIEKRDPMAVIDPLWWKVNIYGSKEDYEKDLQSFSIQQRAVFAVMWYMSEVKNGGHYQFYTNATGIVWRDAQEGFGLIGIREGKKIIAESALRFGAPPSFDRLERENQLDLINESFKDSDRLFYKLDSETDLVERIADYITANPSPFYFEGEVKIPSYQ